MFLATVLMDAKTEILCSLQMLKAVHTLLNDRSAMALSPEHILMEAVRLISAGVLCLIYDDTLLKLGQR